MGLFEIQARRISENFNGDWIELDAIDQTLETVSLGARSEQQAIRLGTAFFSKFSNRRYRVTSAREEKLYT